MCKLLIYHACLSPPSNKNNRNKKYSRSYIRIQSFNYWPLSFVPHINLLKSHRMVMYYCNKQLYKSRLLKSQACNFYLILLIEFKKNLNKTKDLIRTVFDVV